MENNRTDDIPAPELIDCVGINSGIRLLVETKPPFNPSSNLVSLCPSSSTPASLSLPLLSCMVFLVLRSAVLRTFLDLLDTLLQEIIIQVCVGKAFLLDSPFFSENVDVENSNSFLFFRQLGTGKERFCVLDRSKVLDVEHKIYNTYRGRRVKGEHLLFLLSRWYVSRSGFVCGNRAEEIAAESGGDCFLECCCSRQRSFFHGFVFIS